MTIANYQLAETGSLRHKRDVGLEQERDRMRTHIVGT